MFIRRTAKGTFTLIQIGWDEEIYLKQKPEAEILKLKHSKGDLYKGSIQPVSPMVLMTKKPMAHCHHEPSESGYQFYEVLLGVWRSQVLKNHRIRNPKVPPPQSWKRVLDPGTSSQMSVFSGAILVMNSPVTGSSRSDT